MKIGSIVRFEKEDYTVLWVYSNGKCEIQKNDRIAIIKLVSSSELHIL